MDSIYRHRHFRAFVADLIAVGKTTIQTIFLENGKWRYGAYVHVVEGEYLATDRNPKKKTILKACQRSDI